MRPTNENSSAEWSSSETATFRKREQMFSTSRCLASSLCRTEHVENYGPPRSGCFWNLKTGVSKKNIFVPVSFAVVLGNLNRIFVCSNRLWLQAETYCTQVCVVSEPAANGIWLFFGFGSVRPSSFLPPSLPPSTNNSSPLHPLPSPRQGSTSPAGGPQVKFGKLLLDRRMPETK